MKGAIVCFMQKARKKPKIPGKSLKLQSLAYDLLHRIVDGYPWR